MRAAAAAALLVALAAVGARAACEDRSSELQALTGSTCDYVDCSDSLNRAMCQRACGYCAPPCVDQDGVVATYPGGEEVDSCAQAAARGMCEDAFYGRFFQVYCPSSCGSQGASGCSTEAGACDDSGVLDCHRVKEEGRCSNGLNEFPFVAAHCPSACGVCSYPCLDDDLFISTGSIVSKCSNLDPALCDDEVYGAVFRKFCQLTCGTCSSRTPTPTPLPREPGCFDNDFGLMGLTEDAQLNCDYVVANDLCQPGSLHLAFCPKSCNACPRACVDDDDAIRRSPLTSATSCADVPSLEHDCSSPLFASLFYMYCPATCYGCNDSPTSSATEGLTPTASTSISPSASPSPGYVEESGGGGDDNTPAITAAFVLMALAIVALGLAICCRRRMKKGVGAVNPNQNRGRVAVHDAGY